MGCRVSAKSGPPSGPRPAARPILALSRLESDRKLVRKRDASDNFTKTMFARSQFWGIAFRPHFSSRAFQSRPRDQPTPPTTRVLTVRVYPYLRSRPFQKLQPILALKLSEIYNSFSGSPQHFKTCHSFWAQIYVGLVVALPFRNCFMDSLGRGRLGFLIAFLRSQPTVISKPICLAYISI